MQYVCNRECVVSHYILCKKEVVLPGVGGNDRFGGGLVVYVIRKIDLAGTDKVSIYRRHKRQ
jgi:hypothetical protein